MMSVTETSLVLPAENNLNVERGSRTADASAACTTRLHSDALPGITCPASFRSTITGVEIHDSARKHGVADQDILHAIDHALAFEDVGEDPDRWLLIGPDTAGNLLEVVVLTTVEDIQIAIHAMPMRAKYLRLLEP
jgi:hypothetical protein